MSLRPLKLINEGAFGELTLSEQDYLAYKAGLHLSKMDTNDLSALSTNTEAQLIGSFEDTFYTSGTGPVAGETISRTYNVTHSSNLGSSSHTTTFASIINLPSVVYVGDTIEITVVGAATSTGTGFAEIEYQLGVTGVDIGSVSTVATPTASNIEGFRTTWEDFSTKTLTGTYSTTFSFTVTDVGILNITVSATSTDPDNAITNSFDNEDLPSIRVEPEIKPNTSSRVYELYQNNFDVSAIDEQHPSIINPVYWDRTASPAGIKEMNDSELDTVIENLLRRIFAGDLPGQYRLASVAPSNEWSEFIPDIFFDTRGDGSQTNYSIWVKTSNNTIPTPVRVVAPVRLPGSNQFGGFRELKDSQLEYTFGEKMKRIIQTSGIGKYQLRSSEQGVPTDPGVWEARGNAVDTNLSYEEPIGYISVNSYGRDYISSFEGSYTTDYNETYTPTYEGFYSLVNYAGTFLSNYNSVFESRYTGNFVVEYATDYQNETTILYGSESSIDYIGEYSSDYEGTFEGAYQSSYVSLYISDYASEDSETYSENNYEGDFTSDFTTNYTTDYSIDYEVTYITDDYLADYATEYSGIVYRPFEGSFEGDFTSVYDGNIPTTYDGNYIASFEGVYESIYEGAYEVGTYEVYSVDVVNYAVDYTIDTEVVYEVDYTQSTFTSYDAIFEASYEGVEFSGVYSSDEYTGNNFIDFVVDYEGAFTGPLYQGNVFVNYGTDYAPDYVPTYVDSGETGFESLVSYNHDIFVGSYTHEEFFFNATIITEYVGGPYEGITEYLGPGANFIGFLNFLNDGFYNTRVSAFYEGRRIAYSRTMYYQGLILGRYEGSYLGEFVDTDTFSRQLSYEGDFGRTYAGDYETSYSGIWQNITAAYDGTPRIISNFADTIDESVSFDGYLGSIRNRVIDFFVGPRGDIGFFVKGYVSDRTDYLGPGTLDYSGPVTSYDNTITFLEEPIDGQVYNVDNLGGPTPIIYEGGNSYWQVEYEADESQGGEPVSVPSYYIVWEGEEVAFGYIDNPNEVTVGGYTYFKGEIATITQDGSNFTYIYHVIRREAENYEASTSEQNYQGLNQEFYSGDYVGSYGSYIRSVEQLTASGLEIYEGPFSYDGVSFEGPGYEVLYAAEFTGIYEGPEYLGDYGQSFSSEFIGIYAGDSFIGNYLRSYETETITAYQTIADGASYTSGYSSSFLNSQFTSNYVGPVYDLSTPLTFVENYVVEVATQSYSGEFVTTSSINYSTDYVSPYESDVVLPYAGNYAGDYLGIYEGDYQSGYETIYQTPYEGEYVGNYTTIYTTDYETTYIGNYVSDYSDTEYVGEYESSYASNFTNVYTSDYSENYDGVYSSDFASTFTAIFSEPYTGELIIDNYESQYVKDFVSVYINENTEQYTTAFETNYAQVNTGDTEFPGYDGEDSIVAYSTDYDGSYDSKYSDVFLDIDNPQYTDEFGSQLLVPLGSDRLITADGLVFRLFRPNSAIGTYTGNAQLTSTPITLETYTLYARVA